MVREHRQAAGTLADAHYGVEVKYADAPTITKSMRVAIEDLRLRKILVVYPGTRRDALDRVVEVMPLHDALAQIAELRGHARAASRRAKGS
ncbi:MAG TPA: hypothetical protein VF059_10690 [Casimicrobiaceae bacterium]